MDEPKNDRTYSIRKKIYRIGSFAMGTICLGVVVFGALTTYEIYQKEQSVPEHAADYIPEMVKIDPEIAIVKAYQMARNSKIPEELAELQAEVIFKTSKSEGIPIELVIGIIEKESLFNPFSVSNAGATGLMQILRAPNVEIDMEKRHNIKYGIEIGCTILKGKLEKNKGDLSKALSDYSGGAGDYAEAVYESIGRYVMFRNRHKDSGISIVGVFHEKNSRMDFK